MADVTIHMMEDGRVVDTEKAVCVWQERTEWDGSNLISVNTGSQWEHETVYLSRKGNYYIKYSSDWQGALDNFAWLSPERAAKWLLLNGHEIPEDLKEHLPEVE